MKTKRFYILLSIISLISLSLAIVSIFIPKLKGHINFSVFTMVVFMAFCIAAFILGKKAIQSENKYRFIQITLIIIMSKMTLSIIVVLGYAKLMQPADKLFVIPFLINYMLFTAFEVYFLEKVAKEKSGSN